jgi:hypothetical protein
MSVLNLNRNKRDVPGLGWSTLGDAVTLAALMGFLCGAAAGALLDILRYFANVTDLPVAGACAITLGIVGAAAGAGLWAGSEK